MIHPIRHGAIRPLLKRVGLDDKELEIYLAMLALKSAKASNIAKAAKQSRSHTYLVLRSLVEKGLVSEIDRGGIMYFIAEQPQRLISYLEDRKQELENTQTLVKGALPILSSLTKPLVAQPRVSTLHGIDGMRQVYRDVLTQDFCAFFNAEAMFEIFESNIITSLFGKNAKLKGRELFVDNAGAKRYLREIPLDEQYEIRLLPESISFISEFIIFGDTVAQFAYDDDLTIIRIENKNIADSFQSWFEYLWKASKPANKGKK